MIKPQDATVCYLLRGSEQGTEALLGLRNALFASNIWNGPGGKLNEGEDIKTGAIREVQEEINVVVDPTSIRHFATADFYYPDLKSLTHRHSWRVHYLSALRWTGELRIVEGFTELRWFLINSFPYESMMADQVAWLPLAFSRHNGHDNGLLLQVDIFYGDTDGKTIEKGDFRFVLKTPD